MTHTATNAAAAAVAAPKYHVYFVIHKEFLPCVSYFKIPLEFTVVETLLLLFLFDTLNQILKVLCNFCCYKLEKWKIS